MPGTLPDVRQASCRSRLSGLDVRGQLVAAGAVQFLDEQASALDEQASALDVAAVLVEET